MEDPTRDDLLAKFKALGDGIEEVRKALGNPYFYSGRPAYDPESEAHYTVTRADEPGLQLVRDYQETAREVAAIRNQLREGGIAIE